MNDDLRHRGLAAPMHAAPGDDALARALRRSPPLHHPAFTERLLADWERTVRQDAAAQGRAGAPCGWLARRGARGRVGARSRAIVLAFALPLCVLFVQMAVDRIAEQVQLQRLAAPDALSELSFDLL